MTDTFFSKKVLFSLVSVVVLILGVVLWRLLLVSSSVPSQLPVTAQTIAPTAVPTDTVRDYTHDGVIDERDKALIRDHE